MAGETTDTEGVTGGSLRIYLATRSTDAIGVSATLFLGAAAGVQWTLWHTLPVHEVTEKVGVAVKRAFADAALFSGLAGELVWVACGASSHAVVSGKAATEVARPSGWYRRNTHALAAFEVTSGVLAITAGLSALKLFKAGARCRGRAAEHPVASFVVAIGVTQAGGKTVETLTSSQRVVLGETSGNGAFKLEELSGEVVVQVGKVFIALFDVCEDRRAASHLLALGRKEARLQVFEGNGCNTRGLCNIAVTVWGAAVGRTAPTVASGINRDDLTAGGNGEAETSKQGKA